MKRIYILLLFSVFILPVSAQTHYSSPESFDLTSYTYGFKFETHTLLVSGASCYAIKANVMATDYGFAMINIFDMSHQTLYGQVMATPSGLGQTVEVDSVFIVPGTCLIELQVIDIGSASIYFAQPQEISYSYDASGNRISRESVFVDLYSSQKSLKKDTEFRADIENELIDSREFKVYPNPTTQNVFITLNDAAIESAQKTIFLFDNVGRQILEKEALSEIEQIDMSALQPGVYILKLVYGSQSDECIIIKH